MSTQALTVPEQGGAMMAGGGYNPLDSLAPNPIILVQGTTKGVQGIPAGVFLERKSGRQLGTQMQVVLFDAHHMRDKYPSPKYVPGERPICRSFDGVLPVLNREGLTPMAPTCMQCDECSDNRAAWKNYDRKTKEGPKPTCKKSSRLVFAEYGIPELPYYAKVVNKNTKDVDQLKDTLLRNAIYRNSVAKRSGQGRQHINISDYVVTVIAEQAKDGAYYNWKFAQCDLMPEDMAAEYLPLKDSLARRKAAMEAQLEQEEAESAMVEGESV